MKKSIKVIIICILSVAMFQAFTTVKPPEFKNLKILPKDISEHDLDSVMHTFSMSLGVRCNFCHAINKEGKGLDFASDAKPEKDIARMMMTMSININKTYFKDMDMDHDMDHHDMDHDMKTDSSKSKDHDMKMDHDMKGMDNKMMDTTMNAGDVKYMLQTVTCYTCHRGEAHPDTKLPPMKGGLKPPMPPAGGAQPLPGNK